MASEKPSEWSSAFASNKLDDSASNRQIEELAWILDAAVIDKDAEIARLTRERDDSHRAIVSLCPEGEDCIPGGFSAVVAYFVRRIVEEVSPKKHALREAEAEIARLRAALEWYADRNNYQPPCDCCGQDAAIYIDDGTRARDALRHCVGR